MNEIGHRELLMASELVIEPDPDGSYEVTVEASESGWADLSRLQLLAAECPESPSHEPIDILPYSTVESVRLHNTQELIRGQGSRIAAPSGVFSPFRQYGPIQLGKWWLEGGNLVTIRLRAQRVWKSDEPYHLAFSAAFPLAPDNPRPYHHPGPLEGRPRAYVASPSSDAYDSGATTLEVVFDQDGIVDLDSLQLLADRTPVDRPGPEPTEAVAVTAIESIVLPTRQHLVVGGASSHPTPPPRAAPGAIFASLGRRYDWVRFGFLEVSTNNTLTVRVNDLGTGCGPEVSEALGTATYAVGFQFYPSRRSRKEWT